MPDLNLFLPGQEMDLDEWRLQTANLPAAIRRWPGLWGVYQRR